MIEFWDLFPRIYKDGGNMGSWSQDGVMESCRHSQINYFLFESISHFQVKTQPKMNRKSTKSTSAKRRKSTNKSTDKQSMDEKAVDKKSMNEKSMDKKTDNEEKQPEMNQVSTRSTSAKRRKVAEKEDNAPSSKRRKVTKKAVAKKVDIEEKQPLQKGDVHTQNPKWSYLRPGDFNSWTSAITGQRFMALIGENGKGITRAISAFANPYDIMAQMKAQYGYT